MTQQEIINGNKLIAKYMGLVYIPFTTDLKHKAGYWSKVPKTKEELFYSKINGDDGFVCRRHSDLNYYNSLDALIPVIKKIEGETKKRFYLYDNGCKLKHTSFDLPNWSNNVFAVVISFLAEKENLKNK